MPISEACHGHASLNHHGRGEHPIHDSHPAPRPLTSAMPPMSEVDHIQLSSLIQQVIVIIGLQKADHANCSWDRHHKISRNLPDIFMAYTGFFRLASAETRL